MHTKEQLIERLEAMNLDCYEMVSDIKEDTSIQLADFEQLCLFIKKNNINVIFYRFEYPSTEDMQITEDVLDDLRIDDEIAQVMQEDFDQYNGEIDTLDFSRPYILTVCCLYQGCMIYIVESDYWFEAMGYHHPEIMAISMIEKRLDEIEHKKEETYKEREELRNQLREKILADTGFHKCTNKALRNAYAHKLWNTDESIHGLFYSPQNKLYDILIGTFIEEVWREYKGSL